jgi:hypothetical protein
MSTRLMQVILHTDWLRNFAFSQFEGRGLSVDRRTQAAIPDASAV